MLMRVVLVDVTFFFRTLGQAFPLTAKFVVDHVISRKVGPLGMRVFLDDLFHELVVHGVARIGVEFARRRT